MSTELNKLSNCPSVPESLIHAKREELTDLKLNITQMGDRSLPSDLRGHLFIIAPTGTVDSGGLPFVDGDSFLSGDGLIYRFDFDRPGEVRVTTRLVKPPDYYADLATWKKEEYARYRFNNHGIVRFSLALGSRNQLSIAFLPMKFPGEEESRLLVTYDAGRHYEIDTQTLEVATPVGWNKEWRGETKLNFPFQPVLSTAHPAFDARTGELFTVNYGRSLGSFLDNIAIVNAFDKFKEIIGEHFPSVAKFAEKFELLSDFLYLIRWDGRGALERWRLVDASGVPVKIEQSIHQMAVTEDYVVIIDTSFSTGMEQVINNPIPDNKLLEESLRKKFDAPPSPRTNVYLVPRASLGDGQKPAFTNTEVSVKVQKVELPLEVTHFLVDYDNPQGLITLHVAHTTAWDVSEWLRSYDVSPYSPHNPVLSRLQGMEQSELDISRVGRYVINAKTGEVVEQKIIPQVFDRDAQDCRCTWGVALYAYLDRLPSSIYPSMPPGKLDNVYWVSLGLWQDLLTQFMVDFLKDYQPRKVPLEELLNIAKTEGRPSCLFRVNTTSTDSMGVADCYEFPPGYIGLSPQFIPRGDGSSSTNGYIVCTVWFENCYEVWIFEVDNLKQGPQWKLSHPSLNFGLTLHTAWLSGIGKRQANYCAPVRQDYQDLVNEHSHLIRELFEQEVYPYFK